MAGYIPWKLLESWQCLGCGSCCARFSVNISWDEYDKVKRFFPEGVRLRGGNPYLATRRDGRCRFLWGRMCYLQIIGMKPLSCKIWPFRILLRPDKMDEDFEGLYQIGEKEYFVYLNIRCKGLNKGNPAEFRKTIEEVINILKGKKREQYYSTGRFYLAQNFFLEKRKR